MACIRSRAPAASSPTVRRVMQANLARDTSPEKRLRSQLHRLGLRFRKNASPEPALRCKADIVFPRLRLCVFIDGCFWHGCPIHFQCPKTHASWWREKIQDNVLRDRRKNVALQHRGWRVLRFWEHDVMANLDKCVRRIQRMLVRQCGQHTGQPA